MLFQKKDRSQIVAEEKILHLIEEEAKEVEGSVTLEAKESHCRNVKALSEAFAAINGW